MIKLFQFYRVWGLPNASPFCMKLETYLRMAKISYTCKFISNPQRAPRGKLPFIEMDGETYPDSELIIDHLKKVYGNTLDQDLTPEQRALAVLLDHAFCERIYWVIVYLRWQTDSGWKRVKKDYFSNLPAFPKLFVPDLARRKAIKMLNYQGYGKHNCEEIVQLGCKSLDAVAAILSDKHYFLGDKPSSVDATAFAFLANILTNPIDNALKQHALQIETLKAYCDRMWDEFYSDFAKPK